MAKITALPLMVLAALCVAVADPTDITSSKIKLSGFLAFENGQIVRGISGMSNLEIDHGWLERMIFQFTNELTPSERIKLIMSVEGQYGFSYPQSISDRSTYLPRFWLYPARVEAMYTLGNHEKPPLQIGFGYFPYEFSRRKTPEWELIRNLGEFLFRTGTYPPYSVNSFNAPFSRLLGLRVSSTLFNGLEQDLLFTSDAQIFPTQDFSLTYAAHYNVANCLELGGAICFAHLFSINEALTSPDTFSSIENKHSTMYITKDGDTAYYTFKAVKPAAMLAFDPKPLLPGGFSKMLGKDDGSIYGEICVTGWKDYKNYNTDTNMAYPDFSNRWDRTYYMFGLNVPTFKLLDVLSLEFEHDPNNYPNSYQNVINSNIPAYLVLPGKNIAAWKWSVYMKKTFLKRLTLLGQVARDHMRPSFPTYIQTERDDVLARPGDWWWVLRLIVKY